MCFLCGPDVAASRGGPWQARRAFPAGGGPGSAALPALAQVDVGRASVARNFVSADNIEQAGTQQYGQLMAQAKAKGALAPPGNAQLQRLRAIAQRIIRSPRNGIRAPPSGSGK